MYEDLKQLVVEYPTYPGVDNLSTEIQYLMGCRGPGQFAATLRALINPKEFCPFCRPNLMKSAPLAKTSDWFLIHSDFPKPHVHAQLLILPKKHLTDPRDIDSNDWADIGFLFQKAFDAPGIKIPGGAIFMRFGKPANHSGTIPHLHVNILSPTGAIEHREPLTKKPEDSESNFRRMIYHWNIVREKGGLPWLFSREGIAFSKT